MTVATSRRVANAAPVQGRKFSMSDISGKGSGLPNRYVLHGVEGVGKTSLAARFPSPIFLQTKGETGLETLIDAGRLPDTPHFPSIEEWADMLGVLEQLRTEEHGFKTVVTDTLNGAERLCAEFTCNTYYGGNWTETGFVGYQRGYETMQPEWATLLQHFDRLRSERKMTVLCLAHTAVSNFKNPKGPDYDRYQASMHKYTWEATKRWADVILFYEFETFVEQTDKKNRKGKASSANGRILHTERHASHDAKNRLGLPSEIDMGKSDEEAYANLVAAIKAARAQPQTTQEQ